MYRTPYVLLIGIAAACGAHTEFTPVEHVQGSTVSGLSDASYDLATAGMPSEVRVWSPGAERNPHGTGSIVTVNLTVNNASPDPIELVADQLRLESV
ncbi:MAG TPA: hypothetical protein VHT91_24460, partial [Kofleriaceae bacterium]|nr:hypothetical protein [Kofleriaceae bacterium]